MAKRSKATKPVNDNCVLVRIAVGINANGKWCAVGDGNSTDNEKVDFLRKHGPIKVEDIYFVEALVPVPLGVIGGQVVPYVGETV